MVMVERLLAALGLKAQQQGHRWWLETCPMPGHRDQNPAHRWKNFFVRDERSPHHAGQWHCFSCKQHGRLAELVMVVRAVPYREAMEWISGLDDGASAAVPYLRVRVIPENPAGVGFRLPGGVEQPALDRWPDPPRQYLEGRGVTAEQVSRWHVGYSLDGRLAGRVVFPIRGRGGRLASYAARTFCDQETRYLAPGERERPDLAVFWGEHLWPPEEERSTLILLEGVMNGLAVERVLQASGWRGWWLGALQGSGLDPHKSLKLRAWRRVVVATDPDRAGDDAGRMLEAARRFSASRVERFEYPLRGIDACDTPPELLMSALARTLAGTERAGSPGATG